eukprot:scaffold53_cov362-Prasinococcus_capsulatus_cf.AAC.17
MPLHRVLDAAAPPPVPRWRRRCCTAAAETLDAACVRLPPAVVGAVRAGARPRASALPHEDGVTTEGYIGGGRAPTDGTSRL